MKKYWKIILIANMLVISLLSLVGCSENTGKYVGIWAPDTYYENGVEKSLPSSYTFLRFEIKNDQTATMYLDYLGAISSSENFNWMKTDNGIRLVSADLTSNEEYDFHYKQGQLIMTREGYSNAKMYFRKVKE